MQNPFADKMREEYRRRSLLTEVQFLERQADLEYLDRVKEEFRIQAALNVRGIAEAMLLARKQEITNRLALAPKRFDHRLSLIRWHDGVLGPLKKDNRFRQLIDVVKR